MQVGGELLKYNCDNKIISDLHKDKQYQEVCSILDKVYLHIDVSKDIKNEVKVFFHEYRSKMYRVHTLEVALTAFFLHCVWIINVKHLRCILLDNFCFPVVFITVLSLTVIFWLDK